MDVNLFKKSVGKFPTGICIITANYENTLRGFTANSFTSVSLSPPLILFCLNKNSESCKAFRNTDFFAISVLSDQQSDIAQKFAQKNIDRFSDTDYHLGKYSKCPLILNSCSNIECQKYQQIECGDHYIFVGEVKEVEINDSLNPLLYYAKSYHNIK